MKKIEMTLTYFIDGNKILMPYKKKKIGKGKYNGVGGKLEPGETPEVTMIRECSEEVGLIPIDYEYVAELTFIQIVNGEEVHSIVHVFICTKWSGELVETEEMNPKWFDIDDIPYDMTMDNDKYWLPLILQGKKIVGKFNLDPDYITQNYSIEEVSILKNKA